MGTLQGEGSLAFAGHFSDVDERAGNREALAEFGEFRFAANEEGRTRRELVDVTQGDGGLIREKEGFNLVEAV